MASRPCRPDADTKRLWQTLLPGTPFPACGAPEATDGPADKSAEPGAPPQDDAAPNQQRSPRR